MTYKTLSNRHVKSLIVLWDSAVDTGKRVRFQDKKDGNAGIFAGHDFFDFWSDNLIRVWFESLT